MIEEILKLDSNLFIFLNNLGNPNFDFFWIGLSKNEFNIIIYLTATIIYIRTTKKYINYNFKNFLIFILSVTTLIILADQSSNLSKDFFQRLRPCYNDMISESVRLVKDSCGGKYGFFSAHASNSFSLAIFFGLLFKRDSSLLIYFFTFIAFLISYSRIYLGVHYPIDIIIGGIVGIMNGILINRVFLYIIHFFNKT